jgi:PST family polysaccharide transporter
LGVIVLIFISQIVLNTNVFIFKNEAYLKNKKTVIARNIALTIAFLMRLYGIEAQLGLVFFAFTNVIEYFLFTAISYWYFKLSSENKFKLTLNKKMSFFLVKEGLPLLLSAITVILYLKIDQLIIAYLLDNKSVGVYSAASRITEMFYAVPVIISNVFFPRIVTVKNKQGQRHLLLKNLYGIVIFITLIISVLVSYFSDPIIYYLFGESYMEATEILVIYAWSLVFMGLLVSSSKLLLVINRNDIILKRGIMGLISNVVLNFVLIPKMGIVGAAWATLISYSISAYFANIFFKDLRPVMLHQMTSVFYLFSDKSKLRKSE